MAVRWSRGQALVVVLAGVLVLVGGTSFIVRTITAPSCGAERVEDPRSPLVSAASLAQRPQEERGRTVAALEAMGPPFGPVVAGADYYYDQFLRLYGVPGGVLAWTKNNAPVTYLDDADLTPRWSLRPTADRTAWDASQDRFLLLDLDENDPTTVASFDLADGEPAWCVEVGPTHRPGEPVATTFLPGGDVVAALPSGNQVSVLRLRHDDGEQEWSRTIGTADRADFLGLLTEDLLVVGGSEESRLTDPAAPSTTSSTVTALEVATSEPVWTFGGPPGSTLHVVAADDGRLVVLVRDQRGVDLVAVSEAGDELWRRPLPAGGREATLRGGTVVVRADSGLLGYDAATGRPTWRRDLPQDEPTIPLGFSLAQMPSLDADHLLLPTVSSLQVLDVSDGSATTYPMPVEGLSSAYFPYQLLATARHLGVVTNTGAVLTERE